MKSINNKKSDDQLFRLDLLRFPLIVGVVFIHAYATTVDLAAGALGATQGSLVTATVQNLLSQSLARIAVPLFFLMSGYLFFLNFSGSLAGYKSKLQARVKTLLIPFLFWNGLVLLIYFAAQSLPATAKYFSGKSSLVADLGAADMLGALFGVGRFPIAYQFWFIRDLMLLVLLSPCLQWLSNRLIWVLLIGVFSCWFFEIWPLDTPSIEATLFFVLGSVVALKRLNLFGLDAWGAWITCTYVVAAMADVATTGWSANLYVHKVAVLLGMASALYLTRTIGQRSGLREKLTCLGRASFFVFAAHEPLLTIARKLIYSLLHPQSPWMLLALYFMIPSGVILFLLALYRGLSAAAPGFMRVVNGGR